MLCSSSRWVRIRLMLHCCLCCYRCAFGADALVTGALAIADYPMDDLTELGLAGYGRDGVRGGSSFPTAPQASAGGHLGGVAGPIGVALGAAAGGAGAVGVGGMGAGLGGAVVTAATGPPQVLLGISSAIGSSGSSSVVNRWGGIR